MRAPKTFSNRLELLEDRTVPSAGEWLLRLEGLPNTTIAEQMQAAQNLIEAAQIEDVEIEVVDHTGVDGNIVIEVPAEVPAVVLTHDLQAIPGFLSVEPFEDDDDGDAAVAPAPDGSGPLTTDPTPSSGSNLNVGLTGNEPTIAVNPLNPNNVVVAQYNNGQQSLKISLDGGATFPIQRNAPLVSGQSFFQGDDSLAFDSQGRLFWTYLSGGTPTGPNVNAVQINPNTGAVVGSPTLVATTNLDKEWIAADSHASSPFADNLYVIWHDFNQLNAPVRFARSTDHGVTWTTLAGNISGASEGFTWPSEVTVAPNGDVWVAWHTNTIGNGSNGEIRMRRSTDGGLTFGPEIVPFPAGTADAQVNAGSAEYGSPAPPRINQLKSWLQGSLQPRILVDPVRPGNIYVVSVDDPDNVYDANGDPSNIVLARSTDNGLTWTRSTISHGAVGTIQIMPAAAIDPTGNITVTWYDTRGGLTNVSGDYLLDVYTTSSFDGGLTFSSDTRINDLSFDPDLGAPDRFGNQTLRIGEYNGLVSEAGNAYAVWTGNTSTGQQIVFTRYALGFQVIGSTPAQGQVVNTAPTDFIIQLAGAVNPGSVQASDLTVNGIPANSFTINAAGDTINFHYNSTPVTMQGLQSMSIAAGAVVRLSDSSPLFAFNATFRYDAVPLAVVATTPSPGGIFTLPAPFSYDVLFNEDVDAASVGTSDLVLSAGTVTAAVRDSSNSKLVHYTISGISTESLLTISVKAGELADTFGNPNATTFTANYQTDIGTVPYPTPLTPEVPAGSLIYDPTATGLINFAGDTDSFTLNVDPGQTITVLVDPTGSPDPTLYGGVGNGAGSAAGQLLLIDQSTAASTVVGDPVTPGGLSGLVYDPSSGIFLGSTINGGVSTLVRINPDTGALISTVGTITNGAGGPTLSIGDLALQPGTNTLFGITSNSGGPGGLLFTINKSSGVATFVGDTGAGAGGGLAFAPDGSLYQSSFNNFFDFTSLNKINPANAARISTVAVSSYFDGLAIRPTDGVIFAAQGGTGPAVYTINPTTGAITLVGNTSASTSDIAFRPTTALAPTVELRNPSNTLVASASAGQGLNAVIQTVPVLTGGVYKITVGGMSGTTGGYSVRVILNAALESEGIVAGASDNTRATAQDLSSSFLNLQTGANPAQRGAVKGQFTGNDDFYAFNLQAGHSATVGMTLANASTALFGPRTDVAGFNGPLSIAYGDLNGDGKQDMVAANYNDGTVDVLLGNGDGSFGSPVSYFLGDSSTWTVALGDINGDHKLDIVTSNLSSNTVSVLLGNGAGGFGTASLYFVGSSPYGVAVGDLNGDGFADVVSANQYSNSVTVLYGQASGILGGQTDYSVNSSFIYPSAVALGDVNGDGKLDVVTSNYYDPSYSEGSISVLLNNGVGGLGSPTTFVVGSAPYTLALGDVNGDGKLDVVTGSSGGGTVSVLLGDGSGGFGSRADYSTGGSYSYRVAVGDVNGDGKADIAVANTGDFNVAILTNNGDGTFGAATTLPIGGSYDYGVTLADLNGDGLLDLSSANYSSNNVSVWLNATTRIQLQLQDSSGNVLATGISAGNLSAVISNFVAPTTGTYYIRVFGSGSADYSLVVTRDAAFDTESNDTFATAQSISGVQGVLGSLAGAGTNTLTLNWADSGWWDSTGSHDSTNKNYFDGQSGNQYRDYFVFDLTGVSQQITGATLKLYNPLSGPDVGNGYVSSDPSETYTVFDVSTSTAALEASGSGQTGIFNDLGTGTSFGSQSVSAADNGKVVSVALNDSALASLNAARGGLTALGGAVTTISGSGDQAIFAFTGFGPNVANHVRQLVLNLGAPEDWYSFAVTSTTNAFRLQSSTPADGPGEFGNTLNPKIELYNPSGVLVASGTTLPDGRNEFIQYQPLVTGTYRVRVTSEGGAGGEYFLSKTFNPAPSATVTSPINENGTATLTGTVGDPDPFDTHTVVITWGPGEGTTTLTLAAGVNTFTASHQYLDDNPTGTASDVYPINVTVTDNHGAVGTAATSVTVNNVAPTVAAITGPTLGVRGQTLLFSANFTDVGTQDTHTAVINWGDGSSSPVTISETNGSGSASGSHVYTTSGTYVVTLTVKDDDGGTTVVTSHVKIVAAALLPDPLHPGQLALYVGGTTDDDEIEIEQDCYGRYEVEIESGEGDCRRGSNHSEFEASFSGPISRIVVYGQAGDDDIEVDDDIAVQSWLYGDDGNDHLEGGRGLNVLLGGNGDDELIDGSGRGILIGGNGADRLVGGAGDDILIGGRTAFDNDEFALSAIMLEWSSNRSYADRVANLHGTGSGPRLNGNVFLTNLTVLNDGAQDKLTGSSGQDWFWALGSDKITDKKSNENNG